MTLGDRGRATARGIGGIRAVVKCSEVYYRFTANACMVCAKFVLYACMRSAAKHALQHMRPAGFLAF